MPMHWNWNSIIRGFRSSSIQAAVGRYQDCDTYGGYAKATVAHNTVGLGNPWGYDRLDGLYAEHVKKHGTQFLYEREQNNIGRADTELIAYGDAGQLGLISTGQDLRERTGHPGAHGRLVPRQRRGGGE